MNNEMDDFSTPGASLSLFFALSFSLILILSFSFVHIQSTNFFFAFAGKSNYFGYPPSEANFPYPYMRPLSSMTPTIVTKNGEFFLAIGASGGSVIPTATSLVSEWSVYVIESRERERERGKGKVSVFSDDIFLSLFSLC